MRRSIWIVCLALATPARADTAAAKKLNVQGMKKYAKKEYSAALELFEKAIAEDPSFVLAHYNAASMMSLNDDSAGALAELEWLSKSTDPVAVKAMAKAPTDPDLERASMNVKVRALIKLPAIESMDPGAVLLERTGSWGEDGSACATANLNVTFKKGGTFVAQSEWGCDENDNVEHDKGKWTVVNGTLHLTGGKKLFESVDAHFGPCDDDKADDWCLVVTGADGNEHKLGRGQHQMF